MAVRGVASRRPLFGAGRRWRTRISEDRPLEASAGADRPQRGAGAGAAARRAGVVHRGQQGHVLAFDNLSGLPPWLSDTLCRLTSGGAFSTRRLFTDQDEILFTAARPVILNGIEDVITCPDLADRAILLMLAPIAERQRRP